VPAKADLVRFDLPGWAVPDTTVTGYYEVRNVGDVGAELGVRITMLEPVKEVIFERYSYLSPDEGIWDEFSFTMPEAHVRVLCEALRWNPVLEEHVADESDERTVYTSYTAYVVSEVLPQIPWVPIAIIAAIIIIAITITAVRIRRR